MGLELFDHEVEVCMTGCEAIELFEKIKPDLTIVDLSLPDFNGFAVGKKIRELCPEALMFLLTGSDCLESQKQAKEVGFDRFILKPVRIQKLSQLIDESIQQQNS